MTRLDFFICDEEGRQWVGRESFRYYLWELNRDTGQAREVEASDDIGPLLKDYPEAEIIKMNDGRSLTGHTAREDSKQ